MSMKKVMRLGAAVAFAVIAGLSAAPSDVGAQAGTSYQECRNTSWSTYNSCLYNARGVESAMDSCDTAFGLDMMECDLQLARKLFGSLLPF